MIDTLWREQIKLSLPQFQKLGLAADTVALRDVLATAILWPVRKPLLERDPELVAHLQPILTDTLGTVVNLVEEWPDGPERALAQLSTVAKGDPRLRQGLLRLIEHFDAGQLLAKEISNQLNLETRTALETIEAALVNVGGVIDIQQLHLQITMEEIPPPGPPPKPSLPPQVQGATGREADKVLVTRQLRKGGGAILVGMPGIGKTTLAAIIAQEQRNEKGVFWHQFHEHEGFSSLLWRLAAFLASLGAPEIWQITHNLTYRGGVSLPLGTLGDYVIQSLVNLAQPPILLCFDDFHHVEHDGHVQKFIQSLAKQTDLNGRITLLLTSRQRPRDLPGDWICDISGLNLDATRSFFQERDIALTGLHAEQLYALTEGNPIFLTLAAALLHTRDVEEVLARMVASPGVEDFLIDQVDATLTASEQEVMGALSVLQGYPGPRALVEILLGGRSALRPLKRLADRSLLAISESGEERLYSLHATLEQFYYRLQSRSERLHNHRLAAGYYSSEPDSIFQTIFHSDYAGDSDEVVQLVDAHLEELLNQGHGSWLRKLLEAIVAQPLEPEYLARALLESGFIYQYLGLIDQARRAYTEAERTIETLPKAGAASELATKLYLSRGDLLQRDNPPEALGWYAKGLEQAPENSFMHTLLQARRGECHMHMGELEHAGKQLSAAYAQIPPEELLLKNRVLSNLGTVHFRANEFEKAATFYERALTLSRSLHNHMQTIKVLTNLAVCKHIAGRGEEGYQDLREAISLSRQIGDDRGRLPLEGNLGMMLLERGKEDEALEHLLTAKFLADRFNERYFASVALLAILNLYFKQGDYSGGRRYLHEYESLATEIDLSADAGEFWRLRSEYALSQSSVDEGLEYARRSVQLAEDNEDAYQLAMSRATLGAALWCGGENEEALDNYRKSIAALESFSPYEQAYARLGYGRALLDDGQGDTAEKELLLAKPFFEEIELWKKVDEIRDLLGE